MSTLKVNTIRHTGASSDAVTLASDGTCTAKITNNLSNRNLIINGSMQCAQYGSSSTTSGYQTVDRFAHYVTGADEAITTSWHDLTSSDTGPWAKGFRKSWHILNGNQTSGAGSGDYLYLSHKIEAQDMAQSGWNYTSTSSYITLSFWIKSSVAQNFYGYLKTADGTSQNYPFETGSLSADTWTKITKTIPGHANLQFDINTNMGVEVVIAPFFGTDKTGTLSLNAWGAWSSSNRLPDNTSTWWTTNDSTMEITGVQLEVSDHATEFEMRSYGDELVRCQRYYWKWVTENAYGVLSVGWASGSTQVHTVVSYPVTLRGVPSFTTGGNWSFAAGSGSGNTFTPTLERATSSTSYLRSSNTSGLTAGSGGEYRANNDTSAYVAFSAEL